MRWIWQGYPICILHLAAPFISWKHTTKNARRHMQSVLDTSAPPDDRAAARPLTNSQIRRAVLASVIGNGLEWFDFLIYGYFAKTIAHVFFPVGNGFWS